MDQIQGETGIDFEMTEFLRENTSPLNTTEIVQRLFFDGFEMVWVKVFCSWCKRSTVYLISLNFWFGSCTQLAYVTTWKTLNKCGTETVPIRCCSSSSNSLTVSLRLSMYVPIEVKVKNFSPNSFSKFLDSSVVGSSSCTSSFRSEFNKSEGLELSDDVTIIPLLKSLTVHDWCFLHLLVLKLLYIFVLYEQPSNIQETCSFFFKRWLIWRKKSYSVESWVLSQM